MTVSTGALLKTLKQHPEKGIAIELPNGEQVPAHFHITELGYVEKHFMDCGGVQRSQKHLQIQIWGAKDYDHRVDAAKWLMIFDLSQPILPPISETAELEVWLEYQTELTSQYPLEQIESKEDHFLLKTGFLQTQCLSAQKLKGNCGDPSNNCCG